MDHNGRIIDQHKNHHRHSQRMHSGEQRTSGSNRNYLHLEIMTEPCLKGDNLEYDEVDLLSECSTPATYIPGKYLQLCDISPDESNDITPWPVSINPSLSQVDMVPLISSQHRHSEEMGHTLHSQSNRKSQRLSLRSPRLLIPIAVCLIVALTALGGLATII